MFLVFLKPIPSCVSVSLRLKSQKVSQMKYNTMPVKLFWPLVFHLSSSKAFTQLKALLLLSSRTVELERKLRKTLIRIQQVFAALS